MKLSSRLQALLEQYSLWKERIEIAPQETIHIDEAAIRVASFYEQFRNSMDWQEEQLLRRSAIEHLLRRKLFSGENSDALAQFLLRELILRRYFPNDAIAVAKYRIVANSIEKYRQLEIGAFAGVSPQTRKNGKLWILRVAASEIEEILAPPIKELGIIE